MLTSKSDNGGEGCSSGSQAKIQTKLCTTALALDDQPAAVLPSSAIVSRPVSTAQSEAACFPVEDEAAFDRSATATVAQPPKRKSDEHHHQDIPAKVRKKKSSAVKRGMQRL